MKPLLLLLLGCIAFPAVNAQNILPQSFNYTPGVGLQKFQNGAWVKPLNDSNIVLNNLAALKGKKPGVYRLPQDGMPCVVPETKDIAAMPNVWKGGVRVPYRSNPPRIPNLAKPQAAPGDTK